MLTVTVSYVALLPFCFFLKLLRTVFKLNKNICKVKKIKEANIYRVFNDDL